MVLSKSCTGITLKALRGETGYPHSASFNALSASSKTSPLCVLLWNSASNHGFFKRRSSRANSEGTVYLQTNKTDDEDSLLRQIFIFTLPEVLEEIPNFTNPGFLEQFGTVALYSDPNSPAAKIVNVQKVAVSSNSDAAFETVYHCLWDCSTNHPSCPILPAAFLRYTPLAEDPQLVKPVYENVAKKSKEQERLGVLPSRVLDVDPSDGSQEPFLHVFDKPSTGFWIALSHWLGHSPTP